MTTPVCTLFVLILRLAVGGTLGMTCSFDFALFSLVSPSFSPSSNFEIVAWWSS